MAILSKQQLEQYQLRKYQYGTDVRKTQQLYGLFGKIIYEGRWLSKRTDPIIIVEMDEAISEREARFYLEVNNHENIIRTLGYVESPSNLTIFIQEYAEFHGLDGVLMDKQFDFSPMILKEMFIQIADAMNHVASKRIVHGDLGCRNVLLFRVDVANPKNNLVKLTDFGLARWVDRPPTKEDASVIPVRFCAPEILRQARHSSYSEKSDVYSMGALMWEALSNGEYPFSSIAKDEDVKEMKLNDGKLSQPDGCDRQLWVLMNNCWNKKPEERPTFDDIRDRLSNMNISEASRDLKLPTSDRPKIHCEYELDIDVKITGLLNNGSPSIYEARWISKDNGKPIVIIEKNEEPSEYEQAFYSKFKNHPQIVHTYGYVGNDRGSIMILQERAPHGNLKELLESGRFKPSIQVLIEIFKQILNVMIDVVGQGLVHGDLRCENILVFEMHPTDPKRNLIKLSNFSLAHPNDPSYTDNRRLIVPVRYCATELLRSVGRTNYSELSDVYSMGVLMWQVLSKGKHPYESSTISGEVRQRKLAGEKLVRLDNCVDQLWSIMEDCWLNEPTIRYNFAEMKKRFSHLNIGDPNNDAGRSGHQNPAYDTSNEEHQENIPPGKRSRNEDEKLTTVSGQFDDPKRPRTDNSTNVRQKSSSATRDRKTSPTQPSPPERQCKWNCGQSYPEGLIEQHERSYCRERPKSPVITHQPTSSIDNQSTSYQASRTPRTTDDRVELPPPNPVQPRSTVINPLFTRTEPPQTTYEQKSESWWSRWLPCCK